jgi:SRSO17 transposase
MEGGMDLQWRDGASASRFSPYVERLTRALGHADRVAPFRAYCVGLMLPGQRKSVEPMAARIEPARVGAAHQSLHHFVAQAAWDDAAVLAAVRDMVLPAMEAQAPIRAWIIDDTGMPKKGRHSVGVGRQYCGQVGKQDNCQVAVTLSVATHQASLPIAFRLYLPEAWAGDPTRRAKAGVPEEIAFQTKPQIALAQIRAVLAADVPRGVVVMDAGYGADGELRAGIEELGLAYVAGVQASVSVWPPGTTPLPPKPWSGRGRPPKLIRRDADHKPVSARDLAKTLPTQAWQSVTWREGSKTSLTSRFATVRVRPAHRDYWRAQPWPEEWLLIEWPEGETEPTRYWLSTLPETIAVSELVDTAKLRWRIERDYQELKQELGLGHYEGRGWRGFHHHATLCLAAYGFLVQERAAFPPSGPDSPALVTARALSQPLRPRGSTAAP